MPLQLVNTSVYQIRVFPYIPICQVLFVRLNDRPRRLYGEKELQSKYMDDDGGPSYWWRDARIKRLQNRFVQVDLSSRLQDRFMTIIGTQESEIIERFERFIEYKRAHELENADDALEEFANIEDRKRFYKNVLRNVLIALFPTLLTVTLGFMPINDPLALWLDHRFFVSLSIATVLSLPISLMAYRAQPGEYVGKREMATIKRKLEEDQGQEYIRSAHRADEIQDKQNV